MFFLSPDIFRIFFSDILWIFFRHLPEFLVDILLIIWIINEYFSDIFLNFVFEFQLGVFWCLVFLEIFLKKKFSDIFLNILGYFTDVLGLFFHRYFWGYFTDVLCQNFIYNISLCQLCGLMRFGEHGLHVKNWVPSGILLWKGTRFGW